MYLSAWTLPRLTLSGWGLEVYRGVSRFLAWLFFREASLIKPEDSPIPLSFVSLSQGDNQSESTSKFYNSSKADVGGNVLILTSCVLRFHPTESFWMSWGAGIAQWLERRTRDWKVAGSNPCWNGGRIFFSRVDFLCWLLFRYPFHPRVTAVARNKSRSFCQKCRWQVTAKHAYTLRMWLLLNRASALVTTCP